MLQEQENRGKKISGAVWAVVAVTSFIVLALGLGITLVLRSPEPPEEHEPPFSRARPSPGKTPPEWTAAPARSPAEAQIVPAGLKLLASSLELFISDGYRPAAPQSVFWKLRLTITAGDYSVLVPTFGADFRLEIDGKRYGSLGVMREAGILGSQPRREELELQPAETRRIEVIFEVPESSGPAELTVTDLGRLSVPSPVSYSGSYRGKVIGTYVESPPRNCKPLLRDPVMAAIQSATNQSLIIARKNGELTVEIPEAGVAGTASKTAAIYEAVLHHGDDSLPCKLRQIHNGQRLILYLKDEPFHQITYVRK